MDQIESCSVRAARLVGDVEPAENADHDRARDRRGMRAGCAVATRFVEPPPPFFDPPVCAVRPETNTDGLRRLITDLPYRLDLAAREPAWAKRVFDPTWIARGILRHLQGEELPQYVPRLYLEGYRPPTRLSSLTRSLGLRVTERFRPEMVWMLDDAVSRGVVASPAPGRRARAPGLLRSGALTSAPLPSRSRRMPAARARNRRARGLIVAVVARVERDGRVFKASTRRPSTTRRTEKLHTSSRRDRRMGPS